MRLKKVMLKNVNKIRAFVLQLSIVFILLHRVIEKENFDFLF